MPRKKVLICNKDGGTGLAAGELFNKTDFIVYNCTMFPCDLKANLRRCRYDVIVLYCTDNAQQVIHTIGKIKEKHPETDVIVVMNLRWVSYDEKFFLRGAALCVWLDETTPTRLACYIRLMLFMKEFPDVDYDIAAYLTAHGLTGVRRGLRKGFYYLCTAVKICMDDPDAVNNMTDKVYVAVAEKCGAPSADSISQAFRNLFGIVEKSPDLDKRIKRRWSYDPVRGKQKTVSERFKDVLRLYQGSVDRIL